MSGRPAKTASCASRAERPCLRQVDRALRRRQKVVASAGLREVPARITWPYSLSSLELRSRNSVGYSSVMIIAPDLTEGWNRELAGSPPSLFLQNKGWKDA